MKALLQRVKKAEVRSGDSSASIGSGYLILLGVGKDDIEKDAVYLSDKIINLRIFSDTEGKLNKSILDISGSILAVSQFTLYADCSRGRRPGFEQSAPREKALELFEFFIKELNKSGLNIKTGFFGQNMEVELVNDGPVTIMLEN